MKKLSLYILRVLLGVFFVILLSIVIISAYKTKEIEQSLFEELAFIFRNSIQKNVEQKTETVFLMSWHKPLPEENIKRYETRTAIYSDTTFTYQARITDRNTTRFNLFQTHLLDEKKLKADDIQVLFDSLLIDKNIHTKSIVGVTASYYTKLNDWSNDTTAINIKQRISFLEQGIYEDINYHAYIDYPFSTLWRLIPKRNIYILLFCNIAIGTFLFFGLYQLKIEKQDNIIHLKNNNYLIKDLLFDVEEKSLISEKKKKTVKLSNQLYELLLLFLKAHHNRVNKKSIKKHFWPNTLNPSTNMTSAVNRLNKELKEVNCFYTIVTDPKNEDYYILSTFSDTEQYH